MTWISEAQKHYEEYVDYYTSLLEGYVEDRMLEIAPAYGELQEMALKALEEVTWNLYHEKDPKWVPTKRYAKKVQDEYTAKIIPELRLMDARLQPYTTSVLHGTVYYGAYTTSYILEKAARCPVTIPNLTKSGVLGIIANPWLPDKRTYSERIRASTALVATKSAETVKKIVTKRMQYSDAAQELSKDIQEGYHNAIRIVRTEMTRANALGTSYAMMANADICEGKYRDATFDSKTSAYCAADADYSRRHPYDLDYDTETNPGLPGRRIPNHPNCRCRWVTILSALGITDRQKAAIDEKGKLYYTNAQTYDDYAKEVGLPTVREMVNNDNPKKYLRPGETLDDLKQDVQRRTFQTQVGKKSIFVPDNSCLIDKQPERGILTVKEEGYYRKEKNTGAFSVLEEPIQKRHVTRIIEEAGMDYSGIDVKVRHDETLIGTGFLGWTSEDGKRVDLFPDAFKSREDLVKTLAHERRHVEQVRLLGRTLDSDDLIRREKEAVEAEIEAWEKYKKGR